MGFHGFPHGRDDFGGTPLGTFPIGMAFLWMCVLTIMEYELYYNKTNLVIDYY